MMLSRTGWDVTPLSVATRPVRAGGHHGDVPRVHPTGGLHLLLLLLSTMSNIKVTSDRVKVVLLNSMKNLISSTRVPEGVEDFLGANVLARTAVQRRVAVCTCFHSCCQPPCPCCTPLLTVPPSMLTLVIVTQTLIVMPRVLHPHSRWMRLSTLVLIHRTGIDVCLEVTIVCVVWGLLHIATVTWCAYTTFSP